MSKVVLITGPSGAGKSTISKELAEHSEGTWALIGQDEIREHVKSGYKHADVAWTDETIKQWEVSILICCDMIKRYHNAGINCVLELFAPPGEFKKWAQYLEDINYKIIVLLPSVDETVSRNASRSLSMKEAKIRENHEWFTQWKPSDALIIDSTSHTVPETMTEINNFLN